MNLGVSLFYEAGVEVVMQVIGLGIWHGQVVHSIQQSPYHMMPISPHLCP